MIDASLVKEVTEALGGTPLLVSPSEFENLIRAALSDLTLNADFHKIVVDYVVEFISQALTAGQVPS